MKSEKILESKWKENIQFLDEKTITMKNNLFDFEAHRDSLENLYSFYLELDERKFFSMIFLLIFIPFFSCSFSPGEKAIIK
jgi:hypothetical protein